MRPIALAIALVVGPVLSLVAATAAGAKVASADRTLVEKLRASSVPVWLPRRFPRSVGVIRSTVVIDAGSRGYYVGYSALPHCGGARSCAIVHVAGYRTSERGGGSSGSPRDIVLPDGVHAFYVPRDCSGASCTEGTLTFRRRQYTYEIDANVARDNLPALIGIYRLLRRVK